MYLQVSTSTMPRYKGIGMPRAKKRKVDTIQAIEFDEMVEPEPPKPFEFEPTPFLEPSHAQRQETRKEEQRKKLQAEASASTTLWKEKCREERAQLRALHVAQRVRVARYARWEKAQKAMLKKSKPGQAGKLWDKMMIEDERVSEIEKSYLWSLVMREVAHVAALEAKVACRDATIRDLR